MALGTLLAVGATILGTAMSAYGQYKEGLLAASMHKQNRALSLRYAKAVREVRAYEEGLFWREASKVGPRQKVITAAAGLEISGTPLKVMKETQLRLEEQAKVMQYEKELEIAQIESGAAISGMQAGLASQAGRFGAFSTILTGAGQLGMKFI